MLNTSTNNTRKASGLSLQNSVQKVVDLANAKGIDVTAEDLMKLVKTHAAGSSASMAAIAVLPGAGSTIAAGVEIGFVWSMYYRICSRLGFKAPKDLLKGLGSAVITNIAGSVASQLIAGTVMSLIPGIGSLGAAAINGLMGYSITYYSGIIFSNLLVRVFKAGADLENLSIDDLKTMAKEEAAHTSFSEIREEAKAAYKNRKQDGVAEVIDEIGAAAAVR